MKAQSRRFFPLARKFRQLAAAAFGQLNRGRRRGATVIAGAQAIYFLPAGGRPKR